MNQKIIITIGISMLTVGGIIGLVLINSSQNKISSEEMMEKKSSEEKMMDDKSPTENNAMMDKSSDSRYIEYSKTNLENASDKRRVLFFYASWCPTCRPTDENIKSNVSKLPEDLIVIRVNYNDPDTEEAEKDLAKKYNITYQHTFVQIDKNGNEITKWNGGQIDEILTNIK